VATFFVGVYKVHIFMGDSSMKKLLYSLFILMSFSFMQNNVVAMEPAEKSKAFSTRFVTEDDLSVHDVRRILGHISAENPEFRKYFLAEFGTDFITEPGLIQDVKYLFKNHQELKVYALSALGIAGSVALFYAGYNVDRIHLFKPLFARLLVSGWTIPSFLGCLAKYMRAS